jgi:PAS domain S-box-containing protein
MMNLLKPKSIIFITLFIHTVSTTVLLVLVYLDTQQNLLLKGGFFIFLSVIIVYFVLNYYLKSIFFLLKQQKKVIEDKAVLLDSIADGVYGVDKESNCTFINRVALEMLELQENEVLGKNQHDVFHHHKPNGEKYMIEDCPIYLSLNDRQTRTCEEYFIKKDNTFFPVCLTVAPTSDNGVVVVFRDITSRKEYEKILKEKVEEEVSKNRTKDILLQHQARLAAMGEMMGNIAHQWRQPLNAITTVISGLVAKQKYDLLQKNDISDANEQILEYAYFMSNTIDDFRNFFNTSQEQQEFFLHDSIYESVNIIKKTYENLQIDLDINIDEHLSIIGIKNLLSQVILNILTNAKDAFQYKNINQKTVTINAKKINSMIIINIQDNAGGVQDTIIDKIFDPYFTTKHQSRGTGIGLYMNTQIIQMHFNGTITCTNELNEHNELGACFTIEINKKS